MKSQFKEKCIKNASREYLPFRGDDERLFDRLERKLAPSGEYTTAKNSDSNKLLVLRNDSLLAERISKNQLTGEVNYLDPETKTWRPWQDSDTTMVRLTLSIKYGMATVNQNDIGVLVERIADERKYDPLLDYFNSLKWDGKPRVATLLSDCLGAPRTDYSAEIMLKFMLGMIGRAYAPGCKFDPMLTLQGTQGIGKTQFAKVLATRPEWCTSISTLAGKDTLQQIRGKWLTVLDEIVALKGKVSQEKMKAFITEQNDDYRPPYGKCTLHVPRRSCFMATTNELEFLADPTGNRRFWIVQCDPAKVRKGFLFADGIEDYVDQCWAEALNYFKKLNPDYLTKAKTTRGDVLWNGLELSNAAEMERQRLAGECKASSPEEDIIEAYATNPQNKGARVCAKYVWTMLLYRNGADMKAKDSKQINEILANSPHFVSLGRQRTDEYGITRAFEVK